MPAQLETAALLRLASEDQTDFDAFADAAKAFYAQASAAPLELVNAALRELSAGFTVPNARKAGFLAMLCGALIEGGADVNSVAASLLSRFQRDVALIAKLHTQARSGQEQGVDFASAAEQHSHSVPGGLEALHGMEYLWRPTVVVLSLLPSARTTLAPDMDGLEHLGDDVEGLYWIQKLLGVLNAEPIVVLEPSTGLGIEGLMSGVVDNFQLHTLLMDVFPRPKGARHRVSQAIAANARGEGEQETEFQVQGCWNMYTWQAITASAELPDASDRSSSQDWIWGEGAPNDIPVFDGKRVILLGPATYERSWMANRVFRLLRAEITISTRLDSQAVARWLERLSAARFKRH